MMIEIILAVSLFGLLLIYLGMPLMKVGPAALLTPDRLKEDLLVKKNATLAFLKDIELDFKLQKMSPEDYAVIRESTLKDGASLLEKLDESSAHAESWQQRLEEDMNKAGKRGRV